MDIPRKQVFISSLLLFLSSALSALPYQGVSYQHPGHQEDDLVSPYHLYSDREYEVFSSPYCDKGGVKTCCVGRLDDCSRPILGTLCYCDEFCNRTRPDCCPDYARVCLGLAPEPRPIVKRCYYQGVYYDNDEKFRMNCKECICREMNSHMDILCENEICLVENDQLERINRDYYKYKSNWKSSNYSQFWGRKLIEGLDRRLGTFLSRKKVLGMNPLPKPLILDPDSMVPRSFDARDKWSGFIGTPSDQDWCASSWVHSTVGVASDRWAIFTKGKSRERLSLQHLLSCNSKNQRGCEGGHLTRAWNFIRRFGLVSDACYPWTGDSTRCQVSKKASSLTARCPEYHRSYYAREGDPRFDRKPTSTLYRMAPVYRVVTEIGIMWEIMESGPVQATMRVYPDFFVYSGGVYSCPKNEPASSSRLHSVRIIGWGEETHRSGRQGIVKYWIVANSWGQWWGEGGYFRIAKGVNECRIEDFILGAWISTKSTSRRPSGIELLYNLPKRLDSVY